MSKLKIKVANLVFNSFVNDSRVLKESISLANNGYQVEVIAHLDRDLKREEEKENFLIKRFSYLNRKITKNNLLKLKAYYSYLRESIYYCKNFDILHCNDLNTLPIAFIIKKFYNKNIKVVYDAHEYETETNNLNGIKKNITKILEKFLIRYVDKSITVSDMIAKEYVRLYNIEKPALVLNTPLYKKIEKKDIFRESLKISKEETIFLYQGALTHGRGIDILLDTFKNIDNKKAVMVFMGYGVLEKKILESAKKYKNIYFHEAVNPEVLLNYTSSADFGISTIEDSCLSYRYCLPNKMFEYAMAEVPAVVSNLPEMKRVVLDNNIGVVARENTQEGLRDAIEDAMKLNKEEIQENLQKIKEIYNWENQEKVLLNVYRDLI